MRAALLALTLVLALPAAAAAAPTLTKVGDFDQPVHVASPPGDPRLFVVEKGGLVKVVGGGTYLDVRDLTASDGERGLLSIAFAPDFAVSGRSYVFLTDAASGALRVLEMPARRELLRIEHPRANHNGGQLQFGPDGLLYVGTGDGGGANDPDRNAQDPGSRLGKILRLDPATGHVEVYASGLRNPWRFSFDGRDILVGDVGQGAREEVDRITAAGQNFGWPCYEGTIRTPGVSCEAPGAVAPVFDRDHAAGFCSITGGYVVRDPGLPSLAGRYLYGDLCLGELRSASLSDPADDRAEPLPVSGAVSFGTDASGRLHVASIAGPVYRIDEPAPTAPAPAAGADTAAPRLSVRVRGRGSAAKRRRVKLRVRCDEACTVVARGRLRGAGALEPARRALPAGKRRTVRLRMSRKVARRLRRRDRRAVATLRIRARDAAGNERVLRRRARVR